MSTIDPRARRALVTGASRGFGRAIAIGLASAGTHVIGVSRDADALGDLRDELGSMFTPMVADVTDDDLAARLISTHHPDLLVLNAGATPHPATLRDQTWETFSRNWYVDVRHVFSFCRAALLAPLAPGAAVISLSSGAARQGSPLSGGYAGAKATVSFVSSYADAESRRLGLGIRFVSLLPKLTPATQLGATFVDAYADLDDVERDVFRARLGETLTPAQVADAVIDVAGHSGTTAPAYLLTSAGLAPLE